MNRSQQVPEGLSTSRLLARLSEQTAELVRDEIRLAQAELRSKSTSAGLGVGMFGASGVLALFGFAGLLTAAIAALSLALPLWLAALIVAAVVLAIAGTSALFAKPKVKAAGSFGPRRSRDSVNQDVTEAEERGTHGRTEADPGCSRW